MGGSPGRQRPYVVFDLGARYDLAGFHVWNFNQTSYTNVGSRDVDVTFSNTSATAGFADLDSFAGASEFAQAPATNSYLGEDKLFATSHSARWVRFDIPLNWGNNSYTVGLSEVRFFGDLYVAPPAPEPSSLLLLGFGGLGMLRFTRRRCRRG